MTPEIWARLEKIVAAASELEADARRAYLTAACGSDRQLLAEAESFLAAHEASAGFLEDASWAPFPNPRQETEPRQEVGDSAPNLAEEVLSGYRVVRKLAQGGMGTVYLAERDDGSFARRVAIKVMRQLPGAATFRRRFQREGYILADLEHPNIARLLDAGTTTAGHPYFVMEFVDGKPIDLYCQEQKLGLPDRLELFRKVCAAVHTAHRNLVVHRDLKPGNILVDQQGEPKLLDFGIAKLLEPEALPFDIEETVTGYSPMTPRYASPEQIQGKPITTASDVYSLGVLLYKLLVGSLPYKLDGDTGTSLPNAILQQDPPRPSTAAAARAENGEPIDKDRARRLIGDLDTVLLKALRKQPDRRYASAEQFAEDLERYLKGLPVIARPDTFSYRANRFVRRHRWAVAGVAAVAAILVGSTITVLLQGQQLAQQRDQAKLERDKAKQVSAFMVDIFQQADPHVSPGQNLTVRAVLDQASEKIHRELSGQREIRAELQMALGRIYSNLGELAAARPLALEALATRRDLVGDDHPAIAENLEDLGLMLIRGGEYPEAEEHLQEALRLRELGGDSSATASTLSHLGTLYRTLKNFPLAEEHLRRSIALAETGGLGDRSTLANSAHELAITLGERGHFQEAGVFFIRALKIREKIFPPEHPDVLSSLESLGIYYGFQGDMESCEAYIGRSLQLREATLDPDHPTLATSRHNMAVILSRIGRNDRVEELFTKALLIREKTLAPGSIRLFESYDALASFYLDQGRPQQARALLTKAIEPALLLLQETPANAELKERLVVYYQRLGNAHRDLGDSSLAIKSWQTARNLYPPPKIPSSLLARSSLARTLFHLGDLEAARPIYQELMESGFRAPSLQELAVEHGLESPSSPGLGQDSRPTPPPA